MLKLGARPRDLETYRLAQLCGGWGFSFDLDRLVSSAAGLTSCAVSEMVNMKKKKNWAEELSWLFAPKLVNTGGMTVS